MKVKLSDPEFNFMSSLDVVDRSFRYYLDELKKEYLLTIAVKNGYEVNDNLEVSIDLKNKSHLLTIKKT